MRKQLYSLHPIVGSGFMWQANQYSITLISGTTLYKAQRHQRPARLLLSGSVPNLFWWIAFMLILSWFILDICRGDVYIRLLVWLVRSNCYLLYFHRVYWQNERQALSVQVSYSWWSVHAGLQFIMALEYCPSVNSWKWSRLWWLSYCNIWWFLASASSCLSNCLPTRFIILALNLNHHKNSITGWFCVLWILLIPFYSKKSYSK